MLGTRGVLAVLAPAVQVRVLRAGQHGCRAPVDRRVVRIPHQQQLARPVVPYGTHDWAVVGPILHGERPIGVSFLRQAKKHFFHSQDRTRAKARAGSQVGSRIGSQERTKERGKTPKEKVKTAKAKARVEKGKDLVTVAVNMVTSSEIAKVLARA